MLGIKLNNKVVCSSKAVEQWVVYSLYLNKERKRCTKQLSVDQAQYGTS